MDYIWNRILKSRRFCWKNRKRNRAPSKRRATSSSTPSSIERVRIGESKKRATSSRAIWATDQVSKFVFLISFIYFYIKLELFEFQVGISALRVTLELIKNDLPQRHGSELVEASKHQYLSVVIPDELKDYTYIQVKIIKSNSSGF